MVMISYITYDENGQLTGAYLQDLQDEHKSNYFTVDDNIRLNWPAYRYDIGSKKIVIAAVQQPSTVPQSVPMRSARLVLYRAGLLDKVQNYIDSLTSEGSEEAKINWEFAQTVQRNDPLVKQLIPSLGKTEAEIDKMFVEASKL